MTALPWTYLALLSMGYSLAMFAGQLDATALIAIALLLLAGFAVRQQKNRYGRYLGHGLFLVLALALALHWLPGFYNGSVIGPEVFTDDAEPYSMYLNLDKPLIGFWLLLVCPWIIGRRSWRLSLSAAKQLQFSARLSSMDDNGKFCDVVCSAAYAGRVIATACAEVAIE